MHIVNREQMLLCILRMPKKRNKAPLFQDQQPAEFNRRQVRLFDNLQRALTPKYDSNAGDSELRCKTKGEFPNLDNKS